MTAQLAAQAHEIDALAYQFAAHLVHSPVGEREQQYRRAFLHELFLQHVDHAEGGLTRAGRSDDEEEVPGLLHAQHQVVELRVALAGVVALECERGVDPRLALQQEQVLAFLTGFEEELKTLIKSTVRRFHKVMLYRPHLAIEHLALGLRIAERHLYPRLVNVDDRPTEHIVARGVGLALKGGIVGIEEDDIALAEVGHVLVLSVGEGELHPLDGHSLDLSDGHHAQVAIDVAGVASLVECGVPYRGESRLLLGSVAHLGEHLLVLHKGEEAVVIVFLQGCGRAHPVEQRLQLWPLVAFPQRSALARTYELGGERLENAEAATREEQFEPGHLVAQPERLEEQVGRRGDVEQAVGVLRVEHVGMEVLVGHAVVVSEDGTIEQRLHIVVGANAGCLGARLIGRLARFLLHHEREVFLNEVHTGLQSECGREEGRLQDGVLAVAPEGYRRGLGQGSLHGTANVLALQFGIGTEMV